MRIGYSFWGFLGDGVVDTPDGGRSHRLTLVEALVDRGHELVFLQLDRDLLEAGDRIDLARCSWSSEDPELDALLLEWRWPIPGRNCGDAARGDRYTPDLDRQRAVVEHYTTLRATPTLIWDKDLALDLDDPIRARPNVRVLEAALFPRRGARTLLFPVADRTLAALERQAPSAPASPERTLVYVGNQYGRDDAFDKLFATPARVLSHAVFGKWPERERWPHVDFRGRIGFDRVRDVYAASVATMLLLPPRYVEVGQMTQRVFEAALAGCVPLGPADVRGIDVFVSPTLVVRDGDDVVTACRRLADPTAAAEALLAVARRLEVFGVSRQLERLDTVAREIGVRL